MPLTRKSFIAGAVLGVGVAGAAAAGIGVSLPHAAAGQEPQLVRASTAPIFAAPPGAPQSFADIFEKVAPAVVSIEVTTRVPVGGGEGMDDLPFPFNQLPQFRQGPDSGGRGAPTPRRGGRNGSTRPAPGAGTDDGDGALNDQNSREALAAGSGFFISADGYIVTNNHVVENASSIRVTMTDKRELKARVVGRDPDSDIAVVKVDGGPFPYVDFENQAKPRVGDWVLAVGNPLELGGTATAGIVSAIARDLPPDTQGSLPSQYIQIDAPINRGNSGGPTFDTYGRVIGVNTAIYSSSGGSIGIGFAVPAAVADSIAKDLIAGKKITRGYLGASIQALPEDTAEALGIPANSGAFVAEVTAGGPGARAGLQAGDIVTSVNGAKVAGSNELTRAVAATHAGDVMHLQLLRGGRPMALDVRAGVRPSAAVLNRGGAGDDQEDQAPQNGPAAANRQTVLGMTVTALTAADRQRYNIGADVRGVVIDSVADDSPAGKLQLRRGDVVVQANQRPVSTPSEFAAAVAEAKKAGRPAVFLLLNRDGHNIGVPVKFDSPKPGPANG